MQFVTDILSAPFICIGWIIVGAIAGALARSLTGAADRPFVSDLILGIVGAIVGGFIAGLLGMGPGPTTRGLELVIINLVIAVVGAVVIILIGRAFTGGGTRTTV